MTTSSPAHARTTRPTPHAFAPRLMGQLVPLRNDPLGFMTRVCQEHGDVVKFRLGPYRTFMLRHPDAVKHVLVDNNHNYDKKTLGWDMMRQLLGQGLLTSEGDFWRRQRRIAQPAFHRQRIAALGQRIVDATLELVPRWEEDAALGRTVDVVHDMSTLALRVVCRTLLSTNITESDDGDALADQIYAAVTAVNEQAVQATRGGITMPLMLAGIHGRKVQRATEVLDKAVYGIIEERRRNPRPATKPAGDDADVLTMLMQAVDEETGEGMSDQQLRDEVLTIFLAGHETTANALAWTLYLLSLHPGVAKRLRGELHDVLQGRPPAVADLPELPYLEQVIEESMRLYPPVWMLDRRCIEDDVIMGHRIPANSLVILSQWVTHRDERFWPNPEGFDPERFTPEHKRHRPRYAYFPFGGGPRQCIGNNFAMMEAKLILATLLPHFAPAILPGRPITPEPLVTLRPQDGLPMELHRLSPTEVSQAAQ